MFITSRTLAIFFGCLGFVSYGEAGGLHALASERPVAELSPLSNLEAAEKLEGDLNCDQVKNGYIADSTGSITSGLLEKPIPFDYSLSPALEKNLVIPDLDQAATIKAFREAKVRHLFLDYDGSLIETMPDPSTSIPDARLTKIFTALNADREKTFVTIVSGRDQKFMDLLFHKYERFTTCSEHGVFLRLPEQEWQGPQSLALGWKKGIIDIMEGFCKEDPTTWIEDKTASLVWHYLPERKPSDETIKAYASQLSAFRGDAELKVEPSKNLIDVSMVGLDKGNMIVRVLNESPHKPDFILAIGDDPSDEFMYGRLLLHERDVLKSQKPILRTVATGEISEGGTWAKFGTRDVNANLELLEKLVGTSD